MGKLFETDPHRNRALADAEAYNAATLDNAFSDMIMRRKTAADSMPPFAIPVADRIADRQNEMARKAVLESVTGKIISLQRDGVATPIADKIKISKTMKQDGYYDTPRARHSFLRFINLMRGFKSASIRFY